jgi:Leucine-rich repeat (LRR) protein
MSESCDLFVRVHGIKFDVMETENVLTLNLSKFIKSINEIEGLGDLTNLQNLNLEGNPIVKIEGLDTLTNLQRLSLGETHITKIEGLDNLTNLQGLDFIYNHITKIEGLENLTRQQEFFL